MEKFAVDLDKVLDDFELEEDQAEQFIKHSDKCDGPEESVPASSKMSTEAKTCYKSSSPTFPLVNSQMISSCPNVITTSKALQDISAGTSSIESLTEMSTKQGAETSNEIQIPPSHTSSPELNELLLDLTESLVATQNGNLLAASDFSSTDIPNLLDSSFTTEDVPSQPAVLLTDMISNGSFNPSQSDGLTDDELVNYLAQLEEEDQVDLVISNLPADLELDAADMEVTNKIPLSLNRAVFSEAITSQEVEGGMAALELPTSFKADSDGTTSEESDDSSTFSDADTAEIDDVPPLIDDPSLVDAGQLAIAEEEPIIRLTETLEEPPVIHALEDNTEEPTIHEPETPVMPHVIHDTPVETLSASASEQEVPQEQGNQGDAQTTYTEESRRSASPLPGSSIPSLTEEEVISGLFDYPSAEGPFIESPPETDQLAEPYSTLTEDERLLGVLKPLWIPDEEAPACMNCSQKFTVIRRRHHCRACGRVLCAACCSSRARLEYMECREERVCLPCLQVLQKVEAYKKWGGLEGGSHSGQPPESNSSQSNSTDSTPTSSPSPHLPKNNGPRVNPNNPAEYCSTVPPPLQAAAAAALPVPAVMVPVGVLKKEGSTSHPRTRSEPKQVIFSDGIRPGGDLAELDAWRSPAETQVSHRSAPRRSHSSKNVPVVPPVSSTTASSSRAESINSPGRKTRLKMPCSALPPVLDGPESVEQLVQVLSDPAAPPVIFALQSSHHPNGGVDPHLLLIRVKLLQLDCCVRRKCWSFSTSGLRWVAQDEIVILLEQESASSTEVTGAESQPSNETLPPADVFQHLLSIYEDAVTKHHMITNLGHTVTPGSFLGSTEHGGFLFFRSSFQCVQQLCLPAPPYLVGVLLQRWEIPWAKVFPLRLLLRLGAEFRYYPCPLFSVRKRKPVFGEVGHTIINLLADMRNFNYSLPAVAGLVVHMQEKETNVLMPKSRYQNVCKALAQSNDHVISLAASFSPMADAHLVCLQTDDGSYQTQAINIHTRPRKVTGASFLVLNGALKSTSGLSGRSSIVEDGVMVQLLPDKLEALKQALIRMEDYTILCGKVTNDQPEETVTLKWVDHEPSPINAGVTSPIDGKSLSGISSIRVTQPRDCKGEGHRLLRWTELFILRAEEASGRSSASTRAEDNGDVTRFAEGVAKATSMALALKLSQLDPHTLVGLRVSLDGDSVEYQAGVDQKPVPSSCIEELDSSLIPLLHRESAAQSLSCVMELWFQIMHP